MSTNRISEFSDDDAGDRPAQPIASTGPAPTVVPLGTLDLYASAWTLAVRDHELDRLFNAAYYYEI